MKHTLLVLGGFVLAEARLGFLVAPSTLIQIITLLFVGSKVLTRL